MEDFHYIDDPLLIVSIVPDYSNLGVDPLNFIHSSYYNV